MDIDDDLHVHSCVMNVLVLVNLALLKYSILMANGMTTDVYHRDNCIAPDIAFMDHETFGAWNLARCW